MLSGSNPDWKQRASRAESNSDCSEEKFRPKSESEGASSKLLGERPSCSGISLLVCSELELSITESASRLAYSPISRRGLAYHCAGSDCYPDLVLAGQLEIARVAEMTSLLSGCTEHRLSGNANSRHCCFRAYTEASVRGNDHMHHEIGRNHERANSL